MRWQSGVMMAVLGCIVLAAALMASGRALGSDFDHRIRVNPVNLSGMFYFHRGESKTSTFSVENMGTIQDTYGLNVTVDNTRFNASLDRNSTGVVQPSQRGYFNLSVRAPEDGIEGERAHINITARSLTAGKEAYLNFFGFIIVNRSVEISCDNDSLEMGPGDTVSFHLNATNNGEINDTYTVRAVMTADQPPWAMNVSEETFDLSPMESIELILNVTSPADRVENATITFMVYSTARPEASAAHVLKCIVKTSWSASLECEVTALDVVPGNATQIDLELTQVSNDPRGHNWSAVAIPSNDSWEVSLYPKEFILVASAVKGIVLTVASPTRSPPGSALALRVVLNCSQVPDHPLEWDINVTVIEVHRLIVLTVPKSHNVQAGGNFTTYFSVSNDGNAEEACVLSAQPPGWITMESRIGSRSGPLFLLQPWEQVRIDLEFFVPKDPDEYECSVRNISLGSADAVTQPFSISFHIIDDNPPIRLEGPVGNATLIEPGMKGVQVSFRAVNRLNLSLPVSLNVSSDNPGCHASLPNGSFTIGPRDRLERWVSIEVDDDAPGGNYSIKIFVGEAEGQAGLIIDLTVVLGPDLKLVRVDRTGTAVEGRSVVFQVTIGNVGRARSGSTTLIVHVNGTTAVLKSILVPSLEPQMTYSTNVSFVPLPANTLYAFEVNADGSLHEQGTAPNRLDVWLDPTHGMKVRTPLIWSAMALLAIVMVILLVALVGIRSRGSTGGKLPSEPEAVPGDDEGAAEVKAASQEDGSPH